MTRLQYTVGSVRPSCRKGPGRVRCCNVRLTDAARVVTDVLLCCHILCARKISGVLLRITMGQSMGCALPPRSKAGLCDLALAALE